MNNTKYWDDLLKELERLCENGKNIAYMDNTPPNYNQKMITLLETNKKIINNISKVTYIKWKIGENLTKILIKKGYYYSVYIDSDYQEYPTIILNMYNNGNCYKMQLIKENDKFIIYDSSNEYIESEVSAIILNYCNEKKDILEQLIFAKEYYKTNELKIVDSPFKLLISKDGITVNKNYADLNIYQQGALLKYFTKVKNELLSKTYLNEETIECFNPKISYIKTLAPLRKGLRK